MLAKEVVVLSSWPIRKKLAFCLALLLITLGVLSISGFFSVYSYRSLARGISCRSAELPVASKLARQVSELRVILSRASGSPKYPIESGPKGIDRQLLRHDFQSKLHAVITTIEEYRGQLERNQQLEATDWRIVDNRREMETLHDIKQSLERIGSHNLEGEDWILDDVIVLELENQLADLHRLSVMLPSFLQTRMQQFSGNVRLEYRTMIVLTWITSLTALVLLGLLFHLFYCWIFKPLRIVVHGSRRVAGGDFHHRICLTSQDEMAELGNAFNDMTRRFQEIRDDLDFQVQQRTKEVVRSEQMASVGFLAAGVAHEINNPLASIALCAESLEDRLHDVLQRDDVLPDGENDEEMGVVRNYLRMIQDEAFRCKQITERLLDFSRMSDVEKQATNLDELVRGVIDMVSHLGSYKEKQIIYEEANPVLADVNPQEFKQVVLNLLTNALDSLDRGGQVVVAVREIHGRAELCVRDNGCGMTEEVRKHLFEPFYTRRRDGQGTGLGMSITFRIVNDHGGTIEVFSDGPGKGSEIIVVLPTCRIDANKEIYHQYQAA